MVARRRRALSDQQERTVTVVKYQDDLPILADRQKAASDFNKLVARVLEKKRGLILSTRPEKSQPFGGVAEFIGACFDDMYPGKHTVLPAPD